MLETYYQYPRVLKRLRSGALGDKMDPIAAYLSEKGYKPASIKIYLERIARFSHFAGRVPTATIRREVIDRFLRSRKTASARISSQTAIAHVLQFLPDRFDSENTREASSNDQLITDYAEHVQQVRGLQPKTCEGLILNARRVLEWHQEHRPSESLSTMTGKDVLALVHNFFVAALQRLHSIVDYIVHAFVPALPAVGGPQRKGFGPIRSPDTLPSNGSLASARGMGGRHQNYPWHRCHEPCWSARPCNASFVFDDRIAQ